MDDAAESQPSLNSAATEGADGVEHSQPLADTADDGIDDAELLSSTAQSPHQVPPKEAPGRVSPLPTDDTPASPLPDSISPLQPPGSGRRHGLAATVEDCPDEALAQASRSPSTPAPSRASALMTPTTPSSSGLSVKSETTVTRWPQTEEEAQGETATQRKATQSRPDVHAPRPRRRPSALDYLVSESPTGIPRAALEVTYRRAEMGANHGPASSSAPAPSVLSSRPEARRQAPDTASHMNWDPSFPAHGEAAPMAGFQRPQAFPQTFGSPQTSVAHGNAAGAMPLPQAAPSVFQPAYAAEKAPMSGYQLLAAKLVGGLGGSPVAPMYRRFEALNHRLLLYMQADLVDLENELRAVDAKDTMERGYGVVPASRRHERWTNSTLAQQRTEILGHIGFKLCQYNKVLSSFRRLQDLPAPSLPDVIDYKSYLAGSRLVADEETSFLDVSEDLVALAKESGAEGGAADTVTALPRLADAGFHQASSRRAESEAGTCVSARRPRVQDELGAALSQLALAMLVAVLVPIVTFAVIPGFAGRLAVVTLVGASVLTALAQSGMVRLLDRGPWIGFSWRGLTAPSWRWWRGFSADAGVRDGALMIYAAASVMMTHERLCATFWDSVSCVWTWP